MDERQRRDETDSAHDRDASHTNDDNRSDRTAGHPEQDRKHPALTRREREERWPIG